MGADNWTDCPQCVYDFRQHIEVLKNNLHGAYGTVCEDEWNDLNDSLNLYSAETEHLGTLREDYEAYSEGTGRVHFIYSCSCRRCGLEYDYSDNKLFWSIIPEVKGKS